MERVDPPAGCGEPRAVRALVADFMVEALKATGSRLATEACVAVEILHCPFGGNRWEWEVQRQFDLGVLSRVDLVGMLGSWVTPHVQEGRLLELTGRVLDNEKLVQWSDVFPQVWGQGVEEGSVYALPADGDVITMMYNEAMLREAGVEAPPQTWDEWVAVSRLFHGRKLGGQAVAGSCIVTAKDDLLPSSFFAFAAPFLQTSGVSQGLFFDPVTLEPKFDNDAFRRALELFQEAVSLSIHNLTGKPPTYTTAAEHFVAKRCPLYYNFVGPMKRVVAMQATSPRPGDALRMALLPGTRHALEGLSGSLAPCDGGKVCPHADADGVNRAPFFAKGGISFAVSNFSTPDRQDLAFKLGAMVMSRQESLHHVLRQESMMDPFRYSHFEGISEPDSPVTLAYRAKGWKHEQLLETGHVLQAAFEHENGARDLSISFTMDYLGDKFDGIMHNFLDGKVSVDGTVSDLTDMWEQLTNDIGRSAQIKIYRRSLGLPPLSVDVPVQHFHRALWLALALFVALFCLAGKNVSLSRNLHELAQEKRQAAEELEAEREVREVMESVPMEKVLGLLRNLHQGGKPPSKQELAHLLRLIKRGGDLWAPKLDRSRPRPGGNVQFLDTVPQEKLYLQAYMQQAMPTHLVRSMGKRRELLKAADGNSQGIPASGDISRAMSAKNSSSTSNTQSSSIEYHEGEANPEHEVPTSISPGLKKLRDSMLLGSKRPQGILTPPKYDPVVLPEFGWWDWDPFSPDLKGHGLCFATRAALETLGVLDFLDLDQEKLWRFIARIEYGMPQNAYHNKRHVSDVVSSLAYILDKGGLAGVLDLSELEIFSAIIAACVHDFEHPGVTNDFLIKTQDPVALLYCDASVNEHYHLARAFQVMTEDASMRFYEQWDSEQWFRFRKIVMEMVLATDMAKHFEIMSKVKAQEDIGAHGSGRMQMPHRSAHLHASKKSASSQNSSEMSFDRNLWLKLAIKAADVSAQCKKWKVARQFADCYIAEVFLQGDMEREQGLGVSPLCDRETTKVALSQVGFIDAIVKPLYETLSQLCPEMDFCLENLEFSRQKWREEARAVSSRESSLTRGAEPPTERLSEPS